MPKNPEELLQHYMRHAGLRPNGAGFRKFSEKHGPARLMNRIDTLLTQVIGTKGMPSATRSDRKVLRANRRLVYLERVACNPHYPRGDRRAKA